MLKAVCLSALWIALASVTSLGQRAANPPVAPDLLKLAARIDSFENSAPQDINALGPTLKQLCSDLASNQFSNVAQQLGLLQRIFTILQSKKPLVPFELELDLLPSLKNSKYQDVTNEDYVKLRKRSAELILSILARVRQEIEIRLTLQSRPSANVRVPDGSAFAGAAPASIKDPGTRKAYEQAIAENEKKAEVFRKNVALQRQANLISTDMEVFLARLYFSKSPDGQEFINLVQDSKLSSFYKLSFMTFIKNWPK
jgi:hypothetical protein